MINLRESGAGKIIHWDENMFSEIDIEFIEQRSKKDLVAIESRIENLVNQMATIGKLLSEAKEVQEKLKSLLDSVKHSNKSRHSQIHIGTGRNCC